MREIILARHGESTASRAGVVDGDPFAEVDLSEEGFEQARRLGEALSGSQIDLCVTSRFLRTRRTADVALAGRAVPRLVLADLDDIRFGTLQGLGLERYRTWFEENGPDAAPPDGESRCETVARFARAFRILLGRPEASVLAVVHGLAVVYALRAAAEEPLDGPVRPPAYATPVQLTVDDLSTAVGGLENWVVERRATCSSN